jgi:hypothetical protein
LGAIGKKSDPLGGYRADFAKSILAPVFGSCWLFADWRVYIAKWRYRPKLAKSRGLTKLNFVTKKINKLTFDFIHLAASLGDIVQSWVLRPSLGFIPTYGYNVQSWLSYPSLDWVGRSGLRLHPWRISPRLGINPTLGFQTHDWSYNPRLGWFSTIGLKWVVWVSRPIVGIVPIIGYLTKWWVDMGGVGGGG